MLFKNDAKSHAACLRPDSWQFVAKHRVPSNLAPPGCFLCVICLGKQTLHCALSVLYVFQFYSNFLYRSWIGSPKSWTWLLAPKLRFQCIFRIHCWPIILEIPKFDWFCFNLDVLIFFLNYIMYIYMYIYIYLKDCWKRRCAVTRSQIRMAYPRCPFSKF